MNQNPDSPSGSRKNQIRLKRLMRGVRLLSKRRIRPRRNWIRSQLMRIRDYQPMKRKFLPLLRIRMRLVTMIPVCRNRPLSGLHRHCLRVAHGRLSRRPSLLLLHHHYEGFPYSVWMTTTLLLSHRNAHRFRHHSHPPQRPKMVLFLPRHRSVRSLLRHPLSMIHRYRQHCLYKSLPRDLFLSCSRRLRKRMMKARLFLTQVLSIVPSLRHGDHRLNQATDLR